MSWDSSLSTEDAIFQAIARGDEERLDARSREAPYWPLFWRGNNALHVSIGACKTHIARKLVDEYGFDVNSENENLTTPLMKAAEQGLNNLCTFLVEHGADLDAQDVEGNTALIRGVRNCNFDAAQVLAGLGADLDIKNDHGQSAAQAALVSGNAEAAAFLIGRGAVLVSNFVSPKVQNFQNSGMVLIDIAFYFSDLASDAIVTYTLYKANEMEYFSFSLAFMLAPSIVMFLLPHQSMMERLVSLAQLRFVYECIVSLHCPRFTVRWGTVQLLHAVLEDFPSLFFQVFLFFTGNQAFGDDPTSLAVSISLGVLNVARTLREMYLQKLLMEVDGETAFSFLLSAFYSLFSVIIRTTMWLFVVLLLKAEGLLSVGLLVLPLSLGYVRFHVGNVHGLTLLLPDIVVSLVFDGALLSSPPAFFLASILSSVESALMLLLPYSLYAFGVLGHVDLDTNGLQSSFSTLEGGLAQDDKTKQYVLLGFGIAWFLNVLFGWFLGRQSLAHGREENRKAEEILAIATKVSTQQTLVPQDDGSVDDASTDLESNSGSSTSSTTGHRGGKGFELMKKKVRPELDKPFFSQIHLTKSFMLWLSILTICIGVAKVAWSYISYFAKVLNPATYIKFAKRSQQRRETLANRRATLLSEHSNDQAGKLHDSCQDIESTTQLTARVAQGRAEASCSNCLDGCASHTGSLLLTLIFVFLLLQQLGCMDLFPFEAGNYCEAVGNSAWGWVFFGLSYWLYLAEALGCRIARALSNMVSSDLGYDQYCQIPKSKPRINFYLEAYHYEKRVETYYDSNGNRQTREWEEKVVTHRASENWAYDAYYDDLGEFPSFEGLCFVTFNHDYFFADDYTRDCFNEAKSSFIRRNNVDTHYSFRLNYSVKRFSPILLVDEAAAPLMLRYSYYMFASLLLFAYPVRLYIDSLSRRHTVNAYKAFRKFR